MKALLLIRRGLYASLSVLLKVVDCSQIFSSLRSAVVCFAAFVCAIFIVFGPCSLLHELGHATIARVAGVPVNHIQMPFLVADGAKAFGWTWYKRPGNPRVNMDLREQPPLKIIVVAAAGPLVELAILAALVALLFTIVDRLSQPRRAFLGFTALWLMVATITNLNPWVHDKDGPSLRTDGGRIVLEIERLMASTTFPSNPDASG